MSTFAPIFLHQKSSKLNCKYKKALFETFVWKSQVQNVGEIDHSSVFLFNIFYWEMILHIGFSLSRIVDGKKDKTSKNSQTRL
jgi:hypothetical protein